MMTMQGDLSVTALYTSQVWAWAGLSDAHLFASPDAQHVFEAANAALAAARTPDHKLAPLHHSLLHRHAMIDHLLGASGYRQVIELAAGLSRRGAATTSDAQVRYTELDLPHVVELKRELLRCTDEGRAVLARPGLRLIEGDVEITALEPFVEPDAPVFVIAEGLMMYLAADARRRLFAKVRQLAEITGEMRLVFDLVPTSEHTEPDIVGEMIKAATGGRSFECDARTRDDIVTALREAGFDHIEVMASNDVAREWGLPDTDGRTLVVLFAAHASSQTARP
ncbi:MAG TPA: class I SAM-dependent methyltransferase [Pseudonocardiaceae bacterium]|nr:class I SAM-dependent methyltransferase [Pseudonocardiaceae bacterium]